MEKRRRKSRFSSGNRGLRQTITRSARGVTTAPGEPETIVPLDLLQKQVEKGKELNLKENAPTLDVIKKMNQVVEEFLRKSKRIIYGGTAIDALLEVKGFKLREPMAVIDYDFYSPLYEVDSVQIANELFAQGYKYVRRVPAIHLYTFRVGAEFAPEFLADVSYVPSKVYDRLPKVKIGDFFYIDPQFAKIDLYKSVTNPHTNVVRWIKSYKRLEAMERLYPISIGKLKSPTIPQEIPQEMQEVIKRSAKNGTAILTTGIYAYNLYASLIPGANAINIPEFEFLAIDPETEAKRFMTALKRAGFKDVTSQNFYGYLEILPPKTVVYHKKQELISIYLIGENCVAVREIAKTKLVNYHVLLMHLYGKYNLDGIIQKNKKDKELYAWLIQSLQELFKKYNESHGTNGLEPENPFRIFQTDCLSYDSEAARLAAYKRTFYGISVMPLYKPEKVRIDPSKLTEIYLGNFLGEPVDETKIKRQFSRLEQEYRKLGMYSMENLKIPKVA